MCEQHHKTMLIFPIVTQLVQKPRVISINSNGRGVCVCDHLRLMGIFEENEELFQEGGSQSWVLIGQR